MWKLNVSIAVILMVLIGLVALGMWGCPTYNVWQQNLSGKAALAKAEQTRQILVTQAKAEEDAAVARAAAIKIVGQASKDFPEYREQEFIGAFAEAVKDGKINQIIYVPTESGIPLLEASRHVAPKP
jgi:regulator of protease activity HflC (stomatin/prohibitin superfamily)